MPDASVPAGPPAKILVADDDLSLVRTLTWILKEHGYNVVAVPGGEGLLTKLEEERPQLLLLDIMMPKVDGLQLLDRKSTRLNSSHSQISYAVFCLKKKVMTRRTSA